MSLFILVAVWVLHRSARLSLSGWFDDRVGAILRSVAAGGAAWPGPDGRVLLLLIAPSAALVLLATMGSRVHPALLAFVDFAVLALVLGCDRLRQATDAYYADERTHRWPHSREFLTAAGLAARRQWISVDARHKDVCSQILALNLQRYFVIIFWFMVGGSGAALLARLAQNAAVREGAGAVLREALEWLPLRFFALSCALLGQSAGVNTFAGRWWHRWPAALPSLSLALFRALHDQAAACPGGRAAHPLTAEVRLLLNKLLLLWMVLFAAVSLFSLASS